MDAPHPKTSPCRWIQAKVPRSLGGGHQSVNPGTEADTPVVPSLFRGLHTAPSKQSPPVVSMQRSSPTSTVRSCRHPMPTYAIEPCKQALVGYGPRKDHIFGVAV